MSREKSAEVRHEKRVAFYRCNLCSLVFASRRLLQVHTQENESHLHLKWVKEQSRVSSVSPQSAVVCGLCSKPFEQDKPVTLTKHLHDHYLEFQGRHFCYLCEVYFIHEKDLDAHYRSAAQGSCGMKFNHSCPCTGHHPPGGSKGHDQDRLDFCKRLRRWEMTQLDAFKTSVDALIKARKDAEGKAKQPRPKSTVDKLLEGLGKGAVEKKSTPPPPPEKTETKSPEASRKAAIERVWALANIIAVHLQKGWTREEIGAAIQAKIAASRS